MYFLSGLEERLKYTTLSDPPLDLDLADPLDRERLGDLEPLYLDLLDLLLDADIERDLDLLLLER